MPDDSGDGGGVPAGEPAPAETEHEAPEGMSGGTAAEDDLPAGAVEIVAVVEALRSERDEYLDHLRRVQAEFENYRKRVVREQTSLIERATESLVERLLPVLDAFELALLSAAGGDAGQLSQGLELLYADLLGVLEQSGLECIAAEGAVFDPQVHEAVMHVDVGEHDEPVVADVMRKGYMLGGKVLRRPMVKVAK